MHKISEEFELTTELHVAALEHLKNSPWTYNGKMVSAW